MTDSIRSPRWPEIVGFRHEVLHTGALAALLSGPQGAAVASELVGRSVVEVTERVVEPRVGPGSRRRADFGFRARIADGTSVRVLVETKVDSQATAEQLRDMRRGAGSDACCVYLVVGYSDCLLPTDHRVFPEDDVRVIDLNAWADLLSALATTGDLAGYTECVADERAQRHRLGAAVRESTANVTGDWRAGDWGPRVVWMAQLRKRLSVRDVAWRDQAWSRVSGHDVLFGREFPGWRVDDPETGHANVYCDIHANADGRWLALKVGGSSAARRGAIDLDELRQRVLATSLGWVSSHRRPSETALTTTAATLALDGLTPRAAASHVTDAVSGLGRIVESCCRDSV